MLSGDVTWMNSSSRMAQLRMAMKMVMVMASAEKTWVCQNH